MAIKAIYLNTEEFTNRRAFAKMLRDELDLEAITAEAQEIAENTFNGVYFARTYDRVAEWQYEAIREALREHGLALEVATGYNAWDVEYDEFNAFVPPTAAQGEKGAV